MGRPVLPKGEVFSVRAAAGEASKIYQAIKNPA